VPNVEPPAPDVEPAAPLPPPEPPAAAAPPMPTDPPVPTSGLSEPVSLQAASATHADATAEVTRTRASSLGIFTFMLRGGPLARPIDGPPRAVRSHERFRHQKFRRDLAEPCRARAGTRKYGVPLSSSVRAR